MAKVGEIGVKRVSKQVHELTDEEVLALGTSIISTSMVTTVWYQMTGREFSRSSPARILKKAVAPAGQHKSILYWWRKDVEKHVPSATETRGRPRKVK